MPTLPLHHGCCAIQAMASTASNCSWTEYSSSAVPPELPDNVETPVAVDVQQPDLLERIGSAIASLAPDRETLVKPFEAATEGAAKAGGAVIVGVKRVADAVNPF